MPQNNGRTAQTRRVLYFMLAAMATFACASVVTLWVWRRPTLAEWSQIRIGDTEQRVLAILGTPSAQYDRDTAPLRLDAELMARRPRPNRSKVFVYVGGADLTMFVWFDNDGKVEDIFITGS